MDETRTVTEPVELRDGETGPVAYGYAARFDTLSQNLGGFVERIAPGTFTKTIAEADVRALFNHDANFVLGRNRSNTLRLTEDENGLAYEIDLPDTTAGRDVQSLLARGDVTGSSFGFRTITDEWGETDEGFPLRTLRTVALRDVGPVTFPAYTAAEAGLRSLAESRHLDYNEVLEAAEHNQLGELLRSNDGNYTFTVNGHTDLHQTPAPEPTARNASVKARNWWMV